MIVDIRIRRCLNVQYEDIRIENIGMEMLKNYDEIICIYKEKEFYASIDWNAVWLPSSQRLLEYINIKAAHEWVNGFDMKKIEEIFFKYKETTTVLLEQPKVQLNAIWTANKVQVDAPAYNIDFSVYMKLKQKGIRSYIVNVPAEVRNVYGTFGRMILTEAWIKETKGSSRESIENNLKRITDLSCEDYFTNVLDKLRDRRQEKQLGSTDMDRKIFLIGPCTVIGQTPSEKYLAEILQSLLEKNNFSYKIIKINGRYFPNEILEYDICQNDIVIFLGTGLRYKDYDLTEDYEQYDGEKNLCTNYPMHTSMAGCTLIAEAMMGDIIVPNNDTSDSVNDKRVLHIAEKEQLEFEAEYEVKLYLKRLDIPRFMRRGNNGAIVMNANPYTIGHRKLVEYASQQVDRLFIFVVEEDASFFSFEERFEMVRRGTKDINNIVVIPSGNFIISNKTFYDYFTKEIDTGKKVDASKDILIFARNIAPYFNIKKRFVGDEPADKITEQYNEQMKNILPGHGCELIEIPRFRNQGTIISGGMVRKALRKKDIDYLQRMLPVTSFNYIYRHLEALRNRNVELKKANCHKVYLTDRLLKIQEIIDFIRKEKNIIIYGIGNDTVQLLKLLKDEEKEKLIFVDKKAETSEILFMGKKVLSPYDLIKKYLDYNIVILSSKYYKEIYYECIDMGIEKTRIKYNSYELYYGVSTDY